MSKCLRHEQHTKLAVVSRSPPSIPRGIGCMKISVFVYYCSFALHSPSGLACLHSMVLLSLSSNHQLFTASWTKHCSQVQARYSASSITCIQDPASSIIEVCVLCGQWHHENTRRLSGIERVACIERVHRALVAHSIDIDIKRPQRASA